MFLAPEKSSNTHPVAQPAAQGRSLHNPGCTGNTFLSSLTARSAAWYPSTEGPFILTSSTLGQHCHLRVAWLWQLILLFSRLFPSSPFYAAAKFIFQSARLFVSFVHLNPSKKWPLIFESAAYNKK